MPIEVASDQLISFSEAAAFLPQRSRPSYATFWRWWKKGVRGVKLETVLVGGRRYTSAEAMRRFSAALSAPQGSAAQVPTSCRQTSIQQAEAELRAQGVL